MGKQDTRQEYEINDNASFFAYIITIFKCDMRESYVANERTTQGEDKETSLQIRRVEC